MIRAVTCVSVFRRAEKVAEVKKKKKTEKSENEMLWLLDRKQNFHLPEGQQEKQTKTKQPSNIHLKVRAIIRN